MKNKIDSKLMCEILNELNKVEGFQDFMRSRIPITDEVKGIDGISFSRSRPKDDETTSILGFLNAITDDEVILDLTDYNYTIKGRHSIPFTSRKSMNDREGRENAEYEKALDEYNKRISHSDDDEE